jgi:hypothetical protein
MSFHDLPYEVAEERVAGMRREADEYRRASEARQGRRQRARRRWILRRRAAATRLTAVARTVNEVVGAIISPSWPTEPQPRRYTGPVARG